jgi:HlyD family secretion protein
MPNKRIPIPVIILIVLVILGTAGYFIWRNQVQTSNLALTASGTIESTEINIAPELAGKVAQVKVEEGDAVKTGDILLTLNGDVLRAQRDVASSALESAKAAVTTTAAALTSAQTQYDIMLNTVLTQDQTGRKQDWKITRPSEFDQPSWYFTQDEQIQAAQKEVSSAEAKLQEKQDHLNTVEAKVTSTTFLKAEQDLVNARQAFLVLKDVQDTANGATNPDELKDAAKTLYDDAKDTLTTAQKDYDDASTSDEADDILTARAEVRVAQEALDTARDYIRKLQTGTRSLQLQAAQDTLDQAKAANSQAQIAAKQAEANLALLDTQITQLTVISPIDGVVLIRLVEPGEVVAPGASALVLSDSSNLTITVYVPEPRIGDVKLGQSVDVSVDSFPGETFKASVLTIADKAEFTPRNVQTVDGRKVTVFAVKLRLEDATGKLKPGMPADVLFK